MRAAARSVRGKSPHIKVADAGLDIVNMYPLPEGCQAAISVLRDVSSLGKNKDWIAPLIKALDAKESWLVSEALSNLGFNVFHDTDNDSLAGRVAKLLEHSDPWVPGRA